MYSFIIALSLYVSMSWGRCREDAAVFGAWFRCAQWFLLVAYAFLFIAIIYFCFVLRELGQIAYPKYCAGNFWDEVNGVMLEVHQLEAAGREACKVVLEGGVDSFMAPANRFMLTFSIAIPVLTLVHSAGALDKLLCRGRKKNKASKTKDGGEAQKDGGSGGAAVAPAGAGAAPGDRSIAELVDAACAGAEGIAASQREFAAKMIDGLGFANERAFAQEVAFLDWARHMPGFPCRVELCLKKYFAAV